MEPKKILLLMASSRLAERIEQAFIHEKFETFRTDSFENAIKILQKENPQAFVADWDASQNKVKEITFMLRDSCKKTCFILISRNKSARERIYAIEEGADDCFLKNEDIDELVAKVKALVRRIDLVDHEPRILAIKDIEINLDTHEVRKGNKLIDLTYTQFKLLYLLASQREYVFTRNEILTKVWGQNAYVTDRTVDVHVKRLREKLGENLDPLKYIQTIHGLGYRFV
jgi:DNA-binding response OmpR family regulator